jgi:hypothetical protein
VNLPFHNPTPYHAFPGSQAAPTVEYCEIFESMGMGRDSAPLFKSIQQYQILYIVSFVHLPHILPISVEHWMHLQTGWIEQHSG